MNIYYPKVAIGNIVHFDIALATKQLSKKAIKEIVKKTGDIIEIELNRFEYLYRNDIDSAYDYYHVMRALFNIFFSTNIYVYYEEYVYTKQLNVVQAYKKAFDKAHPDKSEFNTRYAYGHINVCLIKCANEILDRVLTELEMVVFQLHLDKVKKDCIVQARHFKQEYFFNLPHKVKGFVFQTCDDHTLVHTYAHEHQLPIAIRKTRYSDHTRVILDGKSERIIVPEHIQIEENYKNKRLLYTYKDGETPMYQLEKIKLFTFAVDNRYIKKICQSSWFDGIAPFKSEFMFSSKGHIPLFEEQYNIYYNLISDAMDKDIYIRVPDFRPERPTKYLGEIYTDLDVFNKYMDLFQTNMAAAACASKALNKTIKMVIPMIRLHTEFDLWHDTIDTVFSTHEIETPQVGITIETESAFEYHEDYNDMDFVIIGLNDLTEELIDDYDRYDDLPYEVFNEQLVPGLRDLHQNLRRRKVEIEHMITGNILKNPQIVRKLLSLGFRNFGISHDEIRVLEPIFKNYQDTRGSFEGLALKRKLRHEELVKERAEKAKNNKK